MSDTAHMNLVKLVDRFRSEDACREYLEKLRWPNGVECPRCGNDSVSRIEERNQFDCNDESCRYQFSVTAGTIFHDTHLPLWKWFAAIYLIIESKKGISSAQLGRTLGVSYKTAWYLSHRIRAAVGNDDERSLLKGVIQIDETWVGGKGEGEGRGGQKHLTMVVGAVDDDGNIELKVVKSRDKKSLHKFIKENTDPENRIIVSDAWRGYLGFSDKPDEHVVIPRSKRSKKPVVIDGHHTNSIENVWSLLKRSIAGSYHKLSVKHLDAYLDELEWRFSNRDNPFMFRDTLQRMIRSDNLEYKELTA